MPLQAAVEGYEVTTMENCCFRRRYIHYYNEEYRRHYLNVERYEDRAIFIGHFDSEITINDKKS